MCQKKRKEGSRDYTRKKAAMGYYSIAAYFILLYNLEADTQ